MQVPRPIVIGLLVSAFLLCAGCAAPQEASPSKTVITDATGVSVPIPQEVRRVVSLAPSESEIVAALGGMDRLVGRSDYCDYPPELSAIPSIGGPRSLSTEAIVSLNPDLVVTTGIVDSARIDELRALGLTVVVFEPKTIDDIYENILLMGRLLGEEEQAEAMVGEMQAKEQQITSRYQGIDHPSVLYLLWHDPLYIAGNDTFEHDLLIHAGGVNVMEETRGYVVVSDESIVQREPDVIIVCQSHTAGLVRLKDKVLEKPAFSGLTAVVNRRICEVNADLANRPGPRVIKALESFAECIHS